MYKVAGGVHYKFFDLIEVDRLQKLFDKLYELTGIVAGVADIDGTLLTKTGQTDFCSEFHRGNPKLVHRCTKSTDKLSELISKLHSESEFICYRCENGITHAVTPIMIQDKVSAYIYMSPFILSPLDLEYFRKQALELDLPERKYLTSLQKLPVYSEEEVRKFMEFAVCISELLAQIANYKLKLCEEQTKIELKLSELVNSYEFCKVLTNDRSFKKIEIESDLRKALDRGEFYLLYQPQVNSKTGRVEAVEALIRWNHPERGVIPPNCFIPIAEDTGLIVPIGEWVLRTACKQNKEWQDKGYKPIRVSVNISPIQLRQWDFVNLLERILEEVQLDPSYLELEITENSLMESMEENIEILDRLRQMGVRIALDDFGTGYSSLNYLQQLPINSMKIDKSFVQDIANDRNKSYIAESIIQLAHRLNLEVIAEGVETEEQLRTLVNKNCDIIQGFIFSEPLPSGQVERILRRGRLNLRKFVKV